MEQEIKFPEGILFYARYGSHPTKIPHDLKKWRSIDGEYIEKYTFTFACQWGFFGQRILFLRVSQNTWFLEIRTTAQKPFFRIYLLYNFFRLLNVNFSFARLPLW